MVRDEEKRAQQDQRFRSGFIALVGRTNVGKSTLLNTLLSQKVAITSPKPQTTRNRITGIKTLPTAQLIFLDTPGIHRPYSKLNRYMVDIALVALQEVDLIVFMTDASVEHSLAADAEILERLRAVSTPVFLVLNKVDLVPKPQLLPLIAAYKERFPFAEIIPLSALTGENTERLIEQIIAYLPEGPCYFPPEQATDQPEAFFIAELIREKVFQQTHQEVPYSVAVVVEEITENERGVLHIPATIYVERDSQKGILIGRGGQRLKQIGQAAREEIERLLGTKVYLNLWVKVRKNWTEDERWVKELGHFTS
ncbi:MAG: GTPase Era [Nitrospinota bacterium]|nr:MAG: GTPase Era [Nitrospinota bacterium]